MTRAELQRLADPEVADGARAARPGIGARVKYCAAKVVDGNGSAVVARKGDSTVWSPYVWDARIGAHAAIILRLIRGVAPTRVIPVEARVGFDGVLVDENINMMRACAVADLDFPVLRGRSAAEPFRLDGSRSARGHGSGEQPAGEAAQFQVLVGALLNHEVP